MDKLIMFYLVGVTLFGVFELLRALYYDFKYRDLMDDLSDQIARETGQSLMRYAKLRYSGFHPFLLWPAMALGLLLFAVEADKGTSGLALIPAILGPLAIFGGHYYRPENELIAAHIRAMEANKRLRNQTPQPQQSTDFGASNADDEYFSYQGGQKTRSRRRADPEPDPAPRGYDKRHPDDAALWAVVDDPGATDGERRNALEAILRREAKRGEKRHKAADEVMKLLGYSR